MTDYILAIDQGSSGTKVILVDADSNVLTRSSVSHNQYYPHSGRVEFDPEEVYQNTLSAIDSVLTKSEVSQHDISNISITNQRETIVAWDENGTPVHNAISWQDQRGKEICETHKDHEETIKSKTGLLLDPYFSASKISWLLKNVPNAEQKAKTGDLQVGTVDSWLLWNLTGQKQFRTDYSNACRTSLFNIETLEWDDELLKWFNVPRHILPDVLPSNAIFGHTETDRYFEREIPITGVMGDSQAALFGQTCFEKGMAKATYGTGSSILVNIGEQRKEAPDGLLTSIGWGIDDEITYVSGGNIHTTGDIIDWLVSDLELISDPAQSEALANGLADNEGVYLIPAFIGLGAPYWDSEVKARIIGMTRNTGKAHIVRAGLEAIAYQIKDLVEAITGSLSDLALEELRVDGGPTENGFLMQFQADILDVAVRCSNISEISAMGAAYMGGLTMDIWDDQDDILSDRSFAEEFYPTMDAETRNEYYYGWTDAMNAALEEK